MYPCGFLSRIRTFNSSGKAVPTPFSSFAHCRSWSSVNQIPQTVVVVMLAVMYESIFCWFIAILKEGIDVQVSVYQNRLLLDQISGLSYSRVSTMADEAARISVSCFELSHLSSTGKGSMLFSCQNLNNLPRRHLNWSARHKLSWKAL